MQTLRRLGEFGFIDRLRRGLKYPPSVYKGIGDDAAVLRRRGGRWLLFASDMLVEGVHFNRRLLPPPWIGWKALACNVSDIAAMGGLPRWAVVSLGLPAAAPVALVDGVYAGLKRCARRFGVAIVGGDTVRAAQWIIDVAILGEVDRGKLTLRSGALAGDALFVTGRLGGSYISGAHARFTPRLQEAQELLRRVRVHAMMDLSDGLASDLWQLGRSSGVLLRVEEGAIPTTAAARACRKKRCPCREPEWVRDQGLYHALMDGEDFELLFAVSPGAAKRLPHRIGGCPLTPIGTVVRRGVGVELRSAGGATRPLIPRGFRHF